MPHSAYKIPISVLVIIHTPQLDVLLMERADHTGFWQSVTGSLDDLNEPLALAAAREVKEETGIDITSPFQFQFKSKTRRLASGNETVHTIRREAAQGCQQSYTNEIELESEQFVLRDWQTSIQYSIYPEWRHRYRPDISINTEHWFSLEVPYAVDVTLAPREHLQAIWLPYQQAIDKCFSPSNQAALAELPQRIMSANPLT
jgi:dATP pyrophosphohydrolase